MGSSPVRHWIPAASLEVNEGGMATAAGSRAEVAHLRTLLRGVSDPGASAAIRAMIDELEDQASEIDNGGATDD